MSLIRLAVSNCLKSREYLKVSLVRLVGMMLIVFVKNKHMKYIENVATDSVGTGILGKLVTSNIIGTNLTIKSFIVKYCFRVIKEELLSVWIFITLQCVL